MSFPCSKCLSDTLLGGMTYFPSSTVLWPFFLSSPFVIPLCMLELWQFPVFYIRGKKHHFTLYYCHLWPLATYQISPSVVVSTIRLNSDKVNYLKVELIQNLFSAIEFLQFLQFDFSFIRGQVIRDLIKRKKTSKMIMYMKQNVLSLGVLTLI